MEGWRFRRVSAYSSVDPQPLTPRMRLLSFTLLTLLLPLTGCNTLKIHVAKDRPISLPRGVTEDEKLQSLVAAAKADPNNPETLIEIVRILKANNWNSSAIRVVKTGKNLLDPTACQDLIPASNVRIGGLLKRTTQLGMGVPYVAYYPKDSPALARQPGIPPAGLAQATTAVLTFEEARTTLRFYDLLQTNSITVNGRRTPLAGDFSAPIAVLLSHSLNRSIDVRSMIFTRQKVNQIGLFQFQPYDPNKIPVVLVHGLLSRPEAWVQAMNGLTADPKIRERYQFWFYLYPTGLPVWASAARLRSELDRFHRECNALAPSQNLDRLVLVGHSMGGLICSIMIRQGGDALWKQFSDVPSSALKLSPEAKEQFLRLVYFLPRKDVSRVIFVSTPHRGSKLALRPLAGFVANLIQLPFSALSPYRKQVLQSLREDVRSAFVAPANSIRFLQADSPLLLAILKLPLNKSVPFHTILGDRGKGNSPNSTDGIVPYWSSHLNGAVSEKIVPSGHGANENAQGIRELERILTTY